MAAVSWCALFRKIYIYFAYMVMVSQEQLEGLFCESVASILDLSEIRQWCRAKQLDDRDLQVWCEAMHGAEFGHFGILLYELPCILLYRPICRLWLSLIVLDVVKSPLAVKT
jgi:hypothetical protein